LQTFFGDESLVATARNLGASLFEVSLVDDERFEKQFDRVF